MSWQSQPEIEVMLAADAGQDRPLADWQRVKEYLAQSFAAYLGQPIEPVWEPIYEDISPSWGFSFGIRSHAPLGGPLTLEWYGVISHGHGHTCALVLLFAQDQRAVPINGSEYLYFSFTPTVEGRRQWVSRGWSWSEMHEWDGYQRLSEVCRRMRESAQALFVRPPDAS